MKPRSAVRHSLFAQRRSVRRAQGGHSAVRACTIRPQLRCRGLLPCGIRAYDTDMDFQFTAVFRRVPEGYIAFVEELPGANTQGATPRRSPRQPARSRCPGARSKQNAGAGGGRRQRGDSGAAEGRCVKRRQLVRPSNSKGANCCAKEPTIRFTLTAPQAKTSTVPRHSEINDHLARKICKDLNIPTP